MTNHKDFEELDSLTLNQHEVDDGMPESVDPADMLAAVAAGDTDDQDEDVRPDIEDADRSGALEGQDEAGIPDFQPSSDGTYTATQVAGMLEKMLGIVEKQQTQIDNQKKLVDDAHNLAVSLSTQSDGLFDLLSRATEAWKMEKSNDHENSN